MSSQLPEKIRSAIGLTAGNLGRALVRLGYPNGGKDAVFAETNLVAQLMRGLAEIDPGFDCYLEACLSRGRRIDLLATDGRLGLAAEAKKFGNVSYGCEGLGTDMARLDEFRPGYSPASDEYPHLDWWADADERWGLLMVGSHAGDIVRDVWRAEDPASEVAAHGPPTRKSNDPSPIVALRNKIDVRPGACRGAELIVKSRWQGSADAYLLWAAFRLQ